MAHYSLTPRVKVLAERLLSQKSTLCTEHATTLNALDGDIAGVPAAVKPARRFYELMRQLPLCISADELIVGNQTRKPHGAIFHDESAVRRPSAFQFLNLNSDLDSPDYKLVMEKGVLAIKHQLEEKTRALGSAVSRSGMDEVNGCRAAIYACDALLALAQNLANSAEQLAAAETNAYRRAELLDSAAILHHVPAHPARSFKEACQAFYLFQLALQLDNGSYAVNPKAPTKPCCLTTSTISTTARSPRSRRMKSSNRCGSSWRSCAKCAPPARSTVIRCSTPCCTARALRTRALTNSPICSSARSKT